MKLNYNKLQLLTKYMLTLFLGVLGACNSNLEPTAENNTDGEYIIISKSNFGENNLTWTEAVSKEFEEILKVSGRVEIPPKDLEFISSGYGGTVRELNLLNGQKISKGEILFYLENPAFLHKQEEYLTSVQAYNRQKEQFNRTKALYKDSLASVKEYQLQLSEVEQLKIKVASLKSELLLMNLNPEACNSENLSAKTPIRAAIGGYVSAIKIHEGEYLAAFNPALEIINTDQIHLEIDVFEKDMHLIQLNQKIKLLLPGFADSLEAKVFSIDKALNPENRALRIHAHLTEDPVGSRLVSGQYFEAEIVVDQNSVMSIPISAAIKKDKSLVALALDHEDEENYFLKQVSFPTGRGNATHYEIPINLQKSQFLNKSVLQFIQ